MKEIMCLMKKLKINLKQDLQSLLGNLDALILVLFLQHLQGCRLDLRLGAYGR